MQNDKLDSNCNVNSDRKHNKAKRVISAKKQRRLDRKASSGTPSAAGDAFEKINYLHHAAHLLTSEAPQCPQLGRFYVHSCRQVAQKMCLKVSPDIKRLSCKFCFSYLDPLRNCSPRVRTHAKRKFYEIKCHTCCSVRRFPLFTKQRSPSYPDYSADLDLSEASEENLS